MLDYDNYLKSLSKSDLESILAWIDREKYPDRYKKVKHVLNNFEINPAEIND